MPLSIVIEASPNARTRIEQPTPTPKPIWSSRLHGVEYKHSEGVLSCFKVLWVKNWRFSITGNETKRFQKYVFLHGSLCHRC